MPGQSNAETTDRGWHWPRYNLAWPLALCATGLGSAGVSRTSWAVRRAFVPHRIPLSHQYPAEQHIVRTSLDLSRFPGDS